MLFILLTKVAFFLRMDRRIVDPLSGSGLAASTAVVVPEDTVTVPTLPPLPDPSIEDSLPIANTSHLFTQPPDPSELEENDIAEAQMEVTPQGSSLSGVGVVDSAEMGVSPRGSHSSVVDSTPEPGDLDADGMYIQTETMIMGEMKKIDVVASYSSGVDNGHDSIDPETHLPMKVQYRRCAKRKSDVYDFYRELTPPLWKPIVKRRKVMEASQSDLGKYRLFGYVCLLCVKKLANTGGEPDSTSWETCLQNPTTSSNAQSHLRSCHMNMDSVKQYFKKLENSKESKGSLDSGCASGAYHHNSCKSWPAII